ncbi:MAG: STAS domain-containing protein [Syntrophales bacterium]
MEIERKHTTDKVTLGISGRLDAHWAEQLDRELAEVVREGTRLIRLDMGAIDYVSSAGIRILLKYWKELKAINGSFRIASPSHNVRKILNMAGMLEMLEEPGGSPAAPAAAPGSEPSTVRERGCRFARFTPSPGARLALRIVGSPELLPEARFTARDVTGLSLPPDTVALGVGAFGTDFADCRSRFGEFLAAGGAAVCLPTDGTGTPDYQVAVGTFVPALQALTALVFRGSFAHFFRFEPDGAGGPSLPLSQLVDASHALSGAPQSGFVLIAEADGLVGAHLRRSPVGQEATAAFAYPGVREWLTFTAELTYPRTLVLAAGIAASDTDSRLAPHLRPLGGGTGLAGHIHAAALSFRALPGGLLDLPKTAADLLETQHLLGVLHLLNDDRPISGIGESRFRRGTVWAGPLENADAPGSSPARGGSR